MIDNAPPSPSLRILYAEDYAPLREMIATFLESEGYEVTAVDDGLAAFNRFADAPHQFDLVITDHQMPHLSGLELVANLRAASYPGHIVVFSSTADAATLSAFAELGIDAYLTKPSPFSEIRAVVRAVATEVSSACPALVT